MKWRTIEEATTKRVEGCCVTSEKMLVKGLIDDEDYRIVEANTMVNRNLMCVPVSELNAPKPESEDERIRKVIYTLMLGMRKEIFTTQDEIVTKEKVLAYLEKQKEQKDYRKLYEDIAKSEWFKKAYVGKSLGEEDEKEEQEPVESDDERIIDALYKHFKKLDPAVYVTDHVMYADILDWLEKQEEQKPISQEDFDAAKHEALWDDQKQEWSEEDEEMLNNIEYILHKDISYTPPTKPNSCTGSGNAYYTHQTEIDWLKSLRPSWKPTEEQMDALKELIDDANRAGWVTPGATELYEQLKKL